MSFTITGKKVGIQTPAHTMPLRPQCKPKPLPTNPKTSTHPKSTTQSKPATTSKQNPETKVAQNKKTTEKGPDKVQERKAEQKIQQVKPLAVETIKEEIAKQQEHVKGQQEVWSEITIRYNHYKEKFPTKNGVLSFVPIEDKYSFGDLFKGNYQPVIKVFKTHQVVEPLSRGLAIEFTWKLQEGIEYRLQIEEDEEEEAKYQKKVYKAPAAETKCPCKKNQRVEEINALLKQLKPEQFGSAKHRELLEQRDLQDVLFT